jgi:MFS family permease
VDVVELQRRTVRVLATAQVLGGLGVGAGISVGGLIAEDVSGSTAMAGLAQTASVLGAAVAALPMARLMSARGRRPGLSVGYLVALAGSLLVVAGAVSGSFPLVLTGACLMGAGTATNLQSRYAAADLAEPHHRARALATVVWATTVGVVLGPNLTGPGADVARAVGLPDLGGPLLFSVAAFGAAALVVQAGLRPDPLLVARTLAGAGQAHGHVPLGRSLRAAAGSRWAVLALAAVAVAHTVMVSVMVMTPVHMRHEGATLDVVGIVISLHVAGMYALSPLVGWLTDRLGRVAVIVLGHLVLGAAVLVAGTADGHAVLGVGLLLLGVGWSCALIAGSTLLSESVSTAVRPGVQGAADFTMGICGAAGGALAGVVAAAAGYGALNAVAGLLALPVLVLALALVLRRPVTAQV